MVWKMVIKFNSLTGISPKELPPEPPFPEEVVLKFPNFANQQ